MAHLFSLLALLWVRPIAILHVLKDDAVPVSVSVLYGLTCGLIGAVFPWFSGSWSTGFTASMVVAATLAPVLLGAALWGASTLFGSQTSTWTQSVALAAALGGVFPLASFFQFLAATPGPQLFGAVVIALAVVGLIAMSFVITLEANPLAGAGFGVLGVLAVFGGAVQTWKAQQPRARPPQVEVALAEPLAKKSPPVMAARQERPEPPSTNWTIKLQSVPPGAEVVEVRNGRPRGRTPVTLEFPASLEKVEVRLRFGDSETQQLLEQHGDPFVVVVMPPPPQRKMEEPKSGRLR